jgi:hypothetical protein
LILCERNYKVKEIFLFITAVFQEDILLDEFYRSCFRKKFYETVERLQADLDEWLNQYNYQRPHRGYRNKGLPTR